LRAWADSLKLNVTLTDALSTATLGGKKFTEDTLVNITSAKSQIFTVKSQSGVSQDYKVVTVVAPNLVAAWNTLDPVVNSVTSEFTATLTGLKGTDFSSLLTTFSIVQPDANLKAAADFRGKKIATPQLGNTQDISCRAWLTDGGLKITQLGGDAQVIPTQNPDQLGLFKAKRIDGVWTVEPWLGRLEQEASGKVIVEEKDVATTILVSSVKFLKEKRDLAKKFAQAHAELTDWISKNPEEAQRLIKAELLEETKSDMSPQLIAAAWKRIVLTAETPRASVEKFMQNSVRAGFIKTAPDLSKLFETP